MDVRPSTCILENGRKEETSTIVLVFQIPKSVYQHLVGYQDTKIKVCILSWKWYTIKCWLRVQIVLCSHILKNKYSPGIGRKKRVYSLISTRGKFHGLSVLGLYLEKGARSAAPPPFSSRLHSSYEELLGDGPALSFSPYTHPEFFGFPLPH